MPKKRSLIVVASILGSFIGLAGVTIILWMKQIVGIEMATLMLVALVGLYFGFGVLIAVYRLVNKLE